MTKMTTDAKTHDEPGSENGAGSDKAAPARRRLAWLAAAVVGAALGAYLFLGRIVIEKLVTDLCMPLGMLWLLLTVLCVALLRRRLFLPLLLSALAWCCCFVFGNSRVADAMIESMEGEYLAIDPMAASPMETVILLGGAASEAPNGQVQANSNGDRVVLAARMYHRGLTRRIICTGATIKELSKLDRDEADRGRLLLMDLGVPESAIETLGGRNTAEEMQEIVKRLGKQAPVGILTSAWHLPRAMRLATDAGIDAVPLPASFNTQRREQEVPFAQMIRDFVPNHTALSRNSMVMKELLAGLVNR